MQDPDIPKHRKKVKKKTFVVEYHIAGTKKDQWQDYYKKYESLQGAQDAVRLLQLENDRKIVELKKNGRSWTTKTYRVKN